MLLKTLTILAALAASTVAQAGAIIFQSKYAGVSPLDGSPVAFEVGRDNSTARITIGASRVSAEGEITFISRDRVETQFDFRSKNPTGSYGKIITSGAQIRLQAVE